MKVRIADLRDEATDIRSYRLESATSGHDLPLYTAGSHVDVTISDGVVRQYSLCSDPDDHSHYRIGVQKDAKSTGGSLTIFATFESGQTIEISEPRNHFKLDESGLEFMLIGGGIGVTPILSMAQRLARIGKKFNVFYLARSEDRFAFSQRLAEPDLAVHVQRHNDEIHGMPNLAAMIGPYRSGRRVYCCGPAPMMAAVRAACADWPAKSCVFEHFTKDGAPEAEANSAFEIQIGRNGPVYSVGRDESIAQVLSANGVSIKTQCTRGLCGTCEVGLLEGEVEHRDMVLDDNEKADNTCLMVCVSRAASGRLVLDL
jgi:ferredoxin-NADP reductase